jgi:hypothetical protein
VQWSLEASNSLLRWRLELFKDSRLEYQLGGFFLLAMYLHGGPLRWAGLFASYWGEHFVYQFCGRFVGPCISFWQICETLYLFLRVQEGRFITPSQSAGM